MNKKIQFLLLSVFLSLPVVAFAAVTNIQSLMETLVGSVLWSIFTAIVVFCFVYSGILFLTASGDSTKLTAARSSFVWGIVGVVVGIMAYSIINILSNMLS